MSFVRLGGGETPLTSRVPRDVAGKRRGPIRLGSITLALFLNAGSIKANPLLGWIPIDLTLLLGVLLTLLLLAQIMADRYIPLEFWAPLGLTVLFAVGLLHPFVSDYGYEKMVAFGTLTLLGMFAAVIFLADTRGRKVFLVTLAGIGAVAALLLAVFPARTSVWDTAITLAGTNTISTSRLVLTAVLITLASAILERRKLITVVFLVAFSGLLVLAALSTGSRGPVIAAGVGFTLALLVSSAFRRIRGRGIVVVALAVTIGFSFLSRSDFGGLDRITAFLSGDADTSVTARSTFWRISWEYLLGNPLGGGWGGFAELPSVSGLAVDGKLYPHNVFFEVAVELGWLGLIALVYFVVSSLVRLGRKTNSPLTVALFAVLVFTLVNAMVSGDINDNRMMWALLAVGFASSAWRDKTEPKSENQSLDAP